MPGGAKFSCLTKGFDLAHNSFTASREAGPNPFRRLIIMPGTSYPKDVLEQAQGTAQALQQIDAGFKVGEISLAALENAIGLASVNRQKIRSLQAQLTDLTNEDTTLNAALWDTLKRIRAGIKAAYGDDSSQYEMAGGTRMSEKKKGGRKKAAPPPSE